MTHVSDTLDLVRSNLGTTTKNGSNGITGDNGRTPETLLLLRVTLSTGETSDGSTSSGTRNKESDILTGEIGRLESVLLRVSGKSRMYQDRIVG
jgi:hypothetical protein